MFKQIIITMFLTVCALPTLAQGLKDLTVSHDDAKTCAAPVPATSFLTTDDNVYLYFVIQGVATGGVVAANWIDPSGTIHSVKWNPAAKDGNYCYIGAHLTNAIFSTLAGPWSVAIYLNDQLQGQLPFEVARPGGPIQPRGSAPSYEGYLDDADCNHIYGWAWDKNNPSSPVSVDVLSDGRYLATVTANQPRADLTSSSSFDLSTPNPVRDGVLHTITAKISGTDQFLNLTKSGLRQITCQPNASSAPKSVLFFDATANQVSSRDYLGDDLPWLPVQYNFTAATGDHIYHAFSSIENTGTILGDPQGLARILRISVQPTSAGSRVIFEVPGGGDPNDQKSGGSLQAIIPFGLNVTSITGSNATFGDSSHPVRAAFQCAFTEISRDAIDSALGALSSGYSLSECFQNTIQESSGCSVAYPIINPDAAVCLSAPENHSLYGEKALNTHQIRNVRWKPAFSGPSTSQIIFNLAESADQAVQLVMRKGITVYVNTPRGDLLVDNLR